MKSRRDAQGRPDLRDAALTLADTAQRVLETMWQTQVVATPIQARFLELALRELAQARERVLEAAGVPREEDRDD